MLCRDGRTDKQTEAVLINERQAFKRAQKSVNYALPKTSHTHTQDMVDVGTHINVVYEKGQLTTKTHNMATVQWPTRYAGPALSSTMHTLHENTSKFGGTCWGEGGAFSVWLRIVTKNGLYETKRTNYTRNWPIPIGHVKSSSGYRRS